MSIFERFKHFKLVKKATIELENHPKKYGRMYLDYINKCGDAFSIQKYGDEFGIRYTKPDGRVITRFIPIDEFIELCLGEER